MAIDRFCNLVYFWLVEHLTDRKKAELDRALEQPPVGVRRQPDTADGDGAWSAEAEMAAFTQAQRATAGVTR